MHTPEPAVSVKCLGLLGPAQPSLSCGVLPPRGTSTAILHVRKSQKFWTLRRWAPATCSPSNHRPTPKSRLAGTMTLRKQIPIKHLRCMLRWGQRCEEENLLASAGTLKSHRGMIQILPLPGSVKCWTSHVTPETQFCHLSNG